MPKTTLVYARTLTTGVTVVETPVAPVHA